MAQAMRKDAPVFEQSWLELALEIGGMGAWELDIASGDLIATDVCKAIFGRDRQAPFHKSDLLAAIHPDDRAAAAMALAAMHSPGHDEEFRILHPDGERYVELRGKAQNGMGLPTRVIGVVRDVTRRHNGRKRLGLLRSELLQVARANDLGAMASALAHELNQPLAAAANYLHAAERLMSRDPDQAQAAIAKAESQFVRTKEIIQRIRGFVGMGRDCRAAEDIAQLCRDVLELGRMVPRYEGIAIALDFTPDLPLVMIDKVQIQQVLFNLLRNAAEAMAGQDQRRITICATPQDGQLVLRVSDNGPGLDADIAAHLFQPFHTTKEGGMGVGLSLCRKIVEAHGGRLWHEAGSPGTVFAFSLPLADGF